MFKFKTKKVTIGDFDPDDPYEWTLLIKPQIQDVTNFIHIRRCWNVTEVAKDEENGIDGVFKENVYEIIKGFIKEENYVVQHSISLRNPSIEFAKSKYVEILKDYIEDGWEKDWNMYENEAPGIPKTPSYRKFNTQVSTKQLSLLKNMTSNLINKSQP
jgi:hypothetical protein